MEDTIIKEVASHGTASWRLEWGLFTAGFVALLWAHVQTGNVLIYWGIILVVFSRLLNRVRLSDPDEPEPWWRRLV
jgi:hypothetical protein